VYAYVVPTVVQVLAGNEGYSSYETSGRIDDVSWLFRASGEICVVCCLVELGLGFRLCVSGKPDGLSKAVRVGTITMMAGLGAIAIAYFGHESFFVTRFYEKWVNQKDLLWFRDEGLSLMYVTRKLQATFEITMWLLSLVIVGFASCVVYEASGTRSSGKVCLHPRSGAQCPLLVCSIQ
jgi:hypothetical protein